jgi:hypothetical protein
VANTNLFIRCHWLPAVGEGIDERRAAVATVLDDPVLVRCFGRQWFAKGYSKSKARLKPIERADLTHKRHWPRVRLIDERFYFHFDVWNGQDHPKASSASAMVHSPPVEPDTFVINGQTAFLETCAEWAEILSLGRAIATQLGGVVIVSSAELMMARDEQHLEGGDVAAYAAFWGVDRSGVNPWHRPLRRQGLDLPYESIACGDWADAHAPSDDRLLPTIRLLAAGDPRPRRS